MIQKSEEFKFYITRSGDKFHIVGKHKGSEPYVYYRTLEEVQNRDYIACKSCIKEVK